MATEHYNQISFIHQWHFNKQNGSNSHYHSQGLFLLLCFIATLILLPTLFLCVHICRRRRHQYLSSGQLATIMAATSPQNDQQCVMVDCTDNHHTMLPSSISKSISMVGEGNFGENKECCICLSVFQDNEKVKVLIECQHAYHSECLDMWLSANPSCPLCRASLHVCNSLMKKSTILVSS